MYQIKRKLFHLVVLSSLAILPIVSSEVSAAQQPATPTVTSNSDDNQLAWRRGFYGGGYYGGYYNRGYYPRYYYYNDYSYYPYSYYPYGGYYYNYYYPNYYYSPGFSLRFGW